ncbi:hypothetical protein [Niastella sp. OAS944]|uniref:hypothetical protein n=1 Tax=Niastella sp. OAS944 TaxID=2664089 RepID=UPI0035C84294|nr:hypothetical protein [Chitinophagaceae bacterium OAS944]
MQYFIESRAIQDKSNEHFESMRLFRMVGNSYDHLPMLDVFVKADVRFSHFPSGMYYISGRRLGLLTEESNFPLNRCKQFDPQNIIMQVGKYDQQTGEVMPDESWLELHRHSLNYMDEVNQHTPIFKIAKYSDAFGQPVYSGSNYSGSLIEEYFHYGWEKVIQHLSSFDLNELDYARMYGKHVHELIHHISVTDQIGNELLTLKANRGLTMNGDPSQLGIYLYVNQTQQPSADFANYLQLSPTEESCQVRMYNKSCFAITPTDAWDLFVKYGNNINAHIKAPKRTIKTRSVFSDTNNICKRIRRG